MINYTKCATYQLIIVGIVMLKNNIEIDFKVKCIEENTTQAKIAETVGTSPQYVSRLINNQENIVNKTFLAMMDALGYDVELVYVKKEA